MPRDELFITTKVWISNAGYDKAKASIDESLRKLKSDYIDSVSYTHLSLVVVVVDSFSIFGMIFESTADTTPERVLFGTIQFM